MSSGPCDVGSDRKVKYSMNLESVLGESLQHYGIKRNMNVNFEVTGTKRAILSVRKGCGTGSMIVFTPDGRGKIVNDKKCIEQVKQIRESTPGFDIVYNRGAYVFDVDVNDGVYDNAERRQVEHDSGNSFPVIRIEYWERALSQAQQDHERQQGIEQDDRGENQHTLQQVKVKAPPKLCELTIEERQSHEATHCPFRAWCEICVKAKTQTENTPDSWEMRNTFL